MRGESREAVEGRMGRRRLVRTITSTLGSKMACPRSRVLGFAPHNVGRVQLRVPRHVLVKGQERG